jgi:hypothetical protein
MAFRILVSCGSMAFLEERLRVFPLLRRAGLLESFYCRERLFIIWNFVFALILVLGGLSDLHMKNLVFRMLD